MGKDNDIDEPAEHPPQPALLTNREPRQQAALGLGPGRRDPGLQCQIRSIIVIERAASTR